MLRGLALWMVVAAPGCSSCLGIEDFRTADGGPPVDAPIGDAGPPDAGPGVRAVQGGFATGGAAEGATYEVQGGLSIGAGPTCAGTRCVQGGLHH